jgi:2-polyprenyl-6-methoxyphenol hydroxylase-like FAD-dependent oxidoreductase
MSSGTFPGVLVVGAGPTGLCLAITLRRYGVPVRIIDRAPQPSGVSKALAVWSGSLEALQGLGVVEEFLAQGRRLRGLVVGDGDRKLAELAVGDGIDSPYPFPLLLPQSQTEAILKERLTALGVAIERSVELTDLAQDRDGVTATLRHADGTTESTRAAYLVGCDGARSAVRHALGIEFEGYTEPETFLLGDVRIDGGDLDPHHIYVWWHDGGTVALFPFTDHVWRMFARREDAAGEAPPTLAELQQHADRHGPRGLRLHDPQWLSAFRVNERLAARYRSGRCFLAGDAAHIHSPAGGQGMNTGIQDAVNLGWKLASVLQGIGDAEILLGSYEPERRPIARGVVAGAAQKLHAAFATSRLSTVIKDVAITLFGNIPAVQKRLQVELSETEIVYREGPLVALGDPPRRAGRAEVGGRALDASFRVPGTSQAQDLWPTLSQPRHTLLLFEDAGHPIDIRHATAGLTEGAGARLHVLRLGPDEDPRHEVRERYLLRGPGWVLVRPDQVIAARGTGADLTVLENYLNHVARDRP